MASDRTIARIVLYSMVAISAALLFALLQTPGSEGPSGADEDDAGARRQASAAARGTDAPGGGRNLLSRRERGGSDPRAIDDAADTNRTSAEPASRGLAGSERRSFLDRARDRMLTAVGDADAKRREERRDEEIAAEREAMDELQVQLRSRDIEDRLDAVDTIAESDTPAARREAEQALDAASGDDRWEVYEKLMDLAETPGEAIDVAVRALSDQEPSARDQAAYWLSTEDAEAYPQIVPALRRAIAAEQDPDAYSTIESALETLDEEFVPTWLSQLYDEETP
jgi:hypothetical protein